MESKILYPLFNKLGIQDVLPQIQSYIDTYYNSKMKRVSYLLYMVATLPKKYKNKYSYVLNKLHHYIQVKGTIKDQKYALLKTKNLESQFDLSNYIYHNELKLNEIYRKIICDLKLIHKYPFYYNELKLSCEKYFLNL